MAQHIRVVAALLTALLVGAATSCTDHQAGEQPEPGDVTAVAAGTLVGTWLRPTGPDTDDQEPATFMAVVTDNIGDIWDTWGPLEDEPAPRLEGGGAALVVWSASPDVTITGYHLDSNGDVVVVGDVLRRPRDCERDQAILATTYIYALDGHDVPTGPVAAARLDEHDAGC